MFDVFEILVPELSSPAISVRQQESAFGLDDGRVLFVADTRLGSLGIARDNLSDVALGTGGADRGHWTPVEIGSAPLRQSWTQAGTLDDRGGLRYRICHA